MNPGGFLEPCSSTAVRPRVTMTLPERGPFEFPAPYNTIGVRVTNGHDTAGRDALWGNTYSYWPSLNAHTGADHLLVMLGVDRQRGGAGPSLWRVDKRTNEVMPLGPIFPPEHPLSWATAEGWYWSATEADILYAHDGRYLYKLDVLQQPVEMRVVVDIGALRPGRIGWQWHTSHDGRVHSCTLKNGQTYQVEGAFVYVEGDQAPAWHQYAVRGQYDECQVDKSGQWLLIKENLDSYDGEDNLIAKVGSAAAPRILLDRDGAAGHSDNGYSYMVAADNWANHASSFKVWMFDGSVGPQGQECYYTPTWGSELQHLSHCNAQPTLAAQQYVVGSGASRTEGPRNNEVIGFRLDGSCEALVVAPIMTNLDAQGGGNDYAKLPKGNVDVTGEWFLWTDNHGSDRLDAFLVRVPAHLLVAPSPPGPKLWTVIDPDGTTRRFIEVL